MKNLLLALLFSLLMVSTTSADIVYSENFDSQNGIGVSAPYTPPLPDLGVDWTLDVSSTLLETNTQGHFQVKPAIAGGTGNHALEAFNVDGEAVWNSPTIDISGFTDLSFSLLANKGSQAHELQDYFDVRYSVDGAAPTLITGLMVTGGSGSHTLAGNWFLPTTISESLSDGSILDISVTMIVDTIGLSSEFFQLDNVLVTGVAAVPEPTAFLFGSLLTGVAGLTATRRRR